LARVPSFYTSFLRGERDLDSKPGAVQILTNQFGSAMAMAVAGYGYWSPVGGTL